MVLDGPLSFEEVPNAASRHIEEVVRVAVFGLKEWGDTVQRTTRLQDTNKLSDATKRITRVLEDV